MNRREVLHRIERLCDGELSAKELRQESVHEVRRAIACEGHLFALTDPVTCVATAPLADVPMLPWSRLPELVRWRYRTPALRWDVLLDQDVASTSLLTATGGDPDRSPAWSRVQRHLGVSDTALAPLGDRYGCWGFLELWRTRGEFTLDELAFLADAAAPLTAGVRRAVARTFAADDEPLPETGAAVVLLDADLSLRDQTTGAAAALLRLNPPDEPMPTIPAAVYNVGASLLAGEAGVPIGPPWARVHLGARRWVTLRAARLGELVAVSIEPSTALERTDVFARAHGLSGRETEVLGLVVEGLESKEIAGRLFLSEHTVHDHVKAVLAKTGIRSRQVLISRAAGAS